MVKAKENKRKDIEKEKLNTMSNGKIMRNGPGSPQVIWKMLKY